MWNVPWVSTSNVYKITLVHAKFPDREPEGMQNPKSVNHVKAKDGLSRRPRLLRPGSGRCVSNVLNATAKGARFERRIGRHHTGYWRRELTEAQV